jgi:hypothetical protein
MELNITGKERGGMQKVLSRKVVGGKVGGHFADSVLVCSEQTRRVKKINIIASKKSSTWGIHVYVCDKTKQLAGMCIWFF